MYTKNLYDEIFERHKRNGCDQLEIMGGYIGLKPVEDLKATGLSCNVIYGCLKSGIVARKIHKQLIRSTNSNRLLNIYYKQNYNHSKIYLWKKNGEPIDALVGSANFSSSGLQNDNQEVLFDVNDKNELSEINYFITASKSDSILANKSYLGLSKSSPPYVPVKSNEKFTILNTEPLEVMFNGLVINKNQVKQTHNAGGFNWGFKENGKLSPKRNPSAMYIPISVKLIRALPNFFPNLGLNPNFDKGQGFRNSKHVAEAIFDDETTMKISFEATSRSGSEVYYKQITSYPNNYELGEYFRRRLGLAPGKKVELKHLTSYGRSDVKISLVSEGVYYIDFSV
tara:strand:- start:1892 stop:2911 length:1020 start_codon:yes stop_codon:yes gene_type:complete